MGQVQDTHRHGDLGAAGSRSYAGANRVDDGIDLEQVRLACRVGGRHVQRVGAGEYWGLAEGLVSVGVLGWQGWPIDCGLKGGRMAAVEAGGRSPHSHVHEWVVQCGHKVAQAASLLC